MIIGKTPYREEYSTLEGFIEAKKARRLETTPAMSKSILAKSWTQKASARACIKAFCLECMGFDRIGIGECTAYACPLWLKRPYQKKNKCSTKQSVPANFARGNQTKM